MTLLLAWTTSACAARIASVAPENGTDSPARLDQQLFGASDSASEAGDRVAPRRAAVERSDTVGTYVPARTSRPRAFANRPMLVRRPMWWATPFVGFMVLTVLLLFVAWRSPGTPPRGTDPRAASPQDVVCLACSRCSRVVDLPRHRLTRHLFCPRCGATLPRDV
jgi:hypothetical protein